MRLAKKGLLNVATGALSCHHLQVKVQQSLWLSSSILSSRPATRESHHS